MIRQFPHVNKFRDIGRRNVKKTAILVGNKAYDDTQRK
jgi:hypothetical protein